MGIELLPGRHPAGLGMIWSGCHIEVYTEQVKLTKVTTILQEKRSYTFNIQQTSTKTRAYNYNPAQSGTIYGTLTFL